MQLELRLVAGRDALRQALLTMVPQIDELQKKRELMKQQQQQQQRQQQMQIQRMRSPRPAAAASSSSAAAAAAAASSSADEPIVTGSRTREEIDREKRKNAINLDETPAKRPKVEKPTPTTAPAPAAAASTPVQEVEGLAALVTGLSAKVQAAADAWCAEQELGSVKLIAEEELDDIFVAALGFKPPAVQGELILRKRLAKLRGAA